MSKFDELSPEIKSALLENGLSMQNFYTLSTEQRQHVLDRIHNFNSKEEMKQYFNSLF